jgi:flagellar basal-body rod protein FlgG
MNGAFYVGAIGMEAQQRALDTIANNISNVNTPAFKRSDVHFSEILASQADVAASPALIGADDFTAAGVLVDTETMVDQPGKLQSTGNRNDIAIDGSGFIEVMAPAGRTLLWRGGTLRVGEDGFLAAQHGFPLKAAISVPTDATSIEIGSDGIVRAIVGQANEVVEIGQIMLVKAPNSSDLQRLDGGLYQVADSTELRDAQPGEDGAGILVQGSLEQSNVELTAEMVELMMVQRAYAANAQILQAADQLMAIANGLRR